MTILCFLHTHSLRRLQLVSRNPRLDRENKKTLQRNKPLLGHGILEISVSSFINGCDWEPVLKPYWMENQNLTDNIFMCWNGEFSVSWQFNVLITVFVMLTADWQADYWALNTQPRHESDGDGSSPWCPHFVNKRWLLVKWNTDIQRYSPSLSMFAIV